MRKTPLNHLRQKLENSRCLGLEVSVLDDYFDISVSIYRIPSPFAVLRNHNPYMHFRNSLNPYNFVEFFSCATALF
jgi:hypothetical protein